MIEKFDLTLLICMGGNMNSNDFEESQRLRWLVNDNPQKIEYIFEQARFFAAKDDDIHTIITYCKIINRFSNNLTAYEELAEYLYFVNNNDWSMMVAAEGLNYHNSEKLKKILKNSVDSIISKQ